MRIKLEARDLNFYYGDFHAVKSVDLAIPDKRVVAFIGPSGCGKSTLLRTFNRMHELYPRQVARGQLLMNGRDILDPRVDVNVVRAKVGMVFQKPTPFPMSIFDNVAFGVKLHQRLSKDDLGDRVRWALEKAALWGEVRDKLKQGGASLSGGQQQRLCIARAIAVKPEVLLMDEPTSALDPISTAQVEELIAELKSEYCVALVTHNMQQAARISDRTAFLYQGKVIEYSDTAHMFTNPSQSLTEAYITGNFG